MRDQDPRNTAVVLLVLCSRVEHARKLFRLGRIALSPCRRADHDTTAVCACNRALALEQGVDLLQGLEDVDLQVEMLDLGSFQSVVSFAQSLKTSGAKVDVLINNAGVFGFTRRRETVDGLEMHIGVNHFGGHLLTRLMEPIIVDGGRVVFLSSSAHDHPPGMAKTTWDWDNVNFEKARSYDRVLAYCRSKLANVLDSKEFAARLAVRNINTYAVHPGLVKTEIHRSMTESKAKAFVISAGYAVVGWLLLKSPLDGALTTLKCAVDPALAAPEFSGRYWGNMREETPSELARDPASPPRLWKVTEDLLEAKLGKKVDDVLE